MRRIKSIYGVIVMALQFIVPFIIIGISYHSIWSFLNGRRRLTRERAVETNRMQMPTFAKVSMLYGLSLCRNLPGACNTITHVA
ncbi:hypothetical protein RB195_021838 [Necator americanus]|uniref:G-protein coupled receptors family 1 profile domain-containing protein n=1 Tax=Necator americanus TaxID=51031 RepID=A0ABR1ECW0_NECAM